VVSLPVFLSNSGIATAGPIPIISGGHPLVAYPLKVASMGNLSFWATSLLAKSTAAAPSETCELFPAVEHPFFPKEGFSFLRP